MPDCSRCGAAKSISEFSDAQLCRKRFPQCLACSNLRLHALNLGAEPPARLKEASNAATTATQTAAQTSECSRCLQQLPLSRFSKRQLAGAGKCTACAAVASAANVSAQADASRKRQLEGSPDLLARLCAADPAEAQYARELLAGVDEARRAAVEASCERAAQAAAAQVVGPTNRGHALLEHLGWVPGTGLGARRDGATLPAALTLKQQRGRSGLGSFAEGDAGSPAAADTGDE